MHTRRQFLATLGGAIAATPLARFATLLPAERRPLERIGIQLYTLRTLMAKDFEGTLARVAEIGYREVEFAGYYGRTPAQVRDVLAANKLTAPSTHIPLPASDDVWARALDDARTIGHEWIVIPWLDASLRRTPADWPRFAARLDALGASAKKAGLRLAYHNHDFEFQRDRNRPFFDVLLARTDPALVRFEMDCYWVTKGGQDPIAYLKKYPGRFPLLHLKDATAAPERKMVDVGAGTIDFRTILATAQKHGLQHVFVEHDQPADPIASARASYTYLSHLG